MAPFVHFSVDLDVLFPVLSQRDDRERSARIDFKPQPIGVESLVREQRVEGYTVDERSDAHDVVALARHKNKPHQIAECIDQRHDFGGQSAFRAPDGLILSPPLAPVAFW